MRLVLLHLACILFAGPVWAQPQTNIAKSPVVPVTIKTPTNKLENSIGFYTRLGFKQRIDNPLAFTDGKVIIEIDTVKTARAGFNFYKPSWQSVVDSLKQTTNVTKTKNGYKLSDPSGVWIYLVESSRELPPVADSSFSVLGNYQGATLESGNVVASCALYKALGLQQVQGAAEKGFVILSNGSGFTVALLKAGMSPHLFFNPSLTYFNGKRNVAVIENIRKLGIPITQEINWFSKDGTVDNVILRDPGGYGFFIFSD